MERFFLLDKYNTAYDWGLLLTAKSVTPPVPKTTYVELDGAHGSLDLSEALTGEVTYKDRVVSASFTTDKGNYHARDMVLREISSNLHGKKVRIVEPDDPDHFFLGRVIIKEVTNNQYYMKLTLEATCDPWRYALQETVRKVDPAGGTVNVAFHNNGVKTVVPVVTLEAPATLTIDDASTTLKAGSFLTSNLRLKQGVTVVGVQSSKPVTFTYTEADL